MQSTRRWTRRPRGAAVTAMLLAGLLATTALPASAADREIVLDHGHVDGFEVTYDPDAEQLVVMIRDDTRIHDNEAVFRDPHDVTLAYEDEQAVVTMPASEGQWAFLGPHGGADVWMGSQSGGDQGYVPWVGWSTERLTASLDGTGITPVSGQPVSLEIEIDGPGDVFTWQNDSFGGPINRHVDTLATGSPDIIPIANHAHVHTNWVFTAEGDYNLTVTPSLDTVDDGTIDGPATEYHFRVGEGTDDPVDTTLTIDGLQPDYQPGDTVMLSAIQQPDTGIEHYHWYTRQAPGDDWSVVPDEAEETWSFTAEPELDGQQIIVRLFDDEHEVIAESDPVTLAVSDGGGGDDATQSIIVTLEDTAGALVVSVDPDDRTVELPPFELAADGESWQTAGELRPVTVTDTRSGAPGWTASGQVSDFESGDSSFAGSYLGWSPTVLDQAPDQGVAAGDPVSPGFPSGDGLSVARTLASADEGAGTGTAQLGADLDLQVPTDTQVGTYEATLTFTAM